ncbi:MAG: bifunctional phosphoribosylaminoimidazolecarboxamide formyltransferase/IMP cyclohydrolase, partial [Deltaproteobacteria bacterium]|nr:bifunctional phosphoribosylaminoimidazolecarboxamide formyltransferase/IMP cyclohydrolase [Deltaproteobacteria bacterium]
LTDNRLAGVVGSMQKQGKVLSYNNIVDIDGAVALCAEFETPASVIVKHTNPCGCAVDDADLFNAYKKSLAVDPVSAFGGIVALNGEVDGKLASAISETFFEVIVAKRFSAEALKIFEAKKNLRIMELPDEYWTYPSPYMIKDVSGGYLVQERDLSNENLRDCRVVTARKPTDDEYKAMSFGWKVAKHVKSNAIVFSHRDRVVGVGAGQMSRVDSVKVAVMKALSPLKGTALASDAFFPFRDGIDAAFDAGAAAVVQPGGSVRDDEVIKAADEHGMTMIFTGFRHFKH